MEIEAKLKKADTGNPFQKKVLIEVKDVINSFLESIEKIKTEHGYVHDELMNLVHQITLELEAEASKVSNTCGKEVGDAISDVSYMFAEYYPFIVRHFGTEVDGINYIKPEEKDNLIPHSLKECIEAMQKAKVVLSNLVA